MTDHASPNHASPNHASTDRASTDRASTDRASTGGAGTGGPPAGGMDPLALEVIRHALCGIAEEMGAALRRAAHSPNITEREDCSCALATPAGEMCAQAEHIPVHLGAMPASIDAALASYPDLGEGDGVLLNDPYAGGTHLNDLTLVSPVFHAGRLLGYAANRAHHADVGGGAPGSMPAGATEIYQEGLRIPPILAWRAGEPTPGMLEILAANSRAPAERIGDLRAQVGANAVGAARLCALADRLAPDGLADAMDALIAYSERAVRAGIAALPDGEWRFEDALDSDGAGGGPIPIVATVRTRGSELEVDFTGTGAQRPGGVNAVWPVTVSCVAFAVRALVAPDVPPTAGAMRPVRVVAPWGTVVNARPPAAVAAGNVETSQRILDAIFGALAGAVADRIPAASQGTMNNLLIGGTAGPTGTTDAGRPPAGRPPAGRPPASGAAASGAGSGSGFAYYETIAGGQGGHPGCDGMDGVHTGMTNTKNTPAEAIEYAYPLRVRRYELREGTGGAGRHRGGMGIRRDVEILCEDGIVSLQTERRRSRPWGLAGGEPGASGENILIRGGREEPLPDKGTFRARRGDIISIRTPGGGGWGPPPRGPTVAGR